MGKFTIKAETAFAHHPELIYDFTLFTAVRPRTWVFQQINKVGMKEDGTGGVDGFTTISYTFERPGEGVTLFMRELTCKLPKGVGIPDDLLTVCCRPDGIGRYHARIKEELDKEFGKPSGEDAKA